MMIPVRCFTCGKVIGGDWETYKSRVSGGDDSALVLTELGINRVCCRRMFVSHPYDKDTNMESIDEAIKYS
jgi:DNA-directed RNA polymerase subunit N